MKLLIINPGSTSTKLSVYEEEKLLCENNYFHDADILLSFPNVNNQLDFRKQVITDFLKENNISISEIDIYVGRGGSGFPCESGVRKINEQLYLDTVKGVGGSEHPAKLGVMLAYVLAEEYGKQAYTMNPTNVDELCDEARITGIKGVYRNAQSHVLNQKAVGRYYCQTHGRKYEESELIICHIDGGITVNAHHLGKMIDGNVGSGGDGPFTPTRIGSVPVLPLLDYLKEHSVEEVRLMCSRAGGFASYYGSYDSEMIHQKVLENDPKATLLWKAMIYQICKEIGAMSTVLKGKAEAIILTGGLVRFADLVDMIKESCQWIAPVYCYPGEMEQQALLQETLKVLRNEKKLTPYSDHSVFEGFEFLK